ncbi:MAG: helix-turn-helix domain-containing protein [Candidatus Hermodarchaeota archaeon]
MTICKEINDILDTKDLERIKIEFKQSEEIRTGDGQKDLAKELVALANHSGGRLIIGITDEGDFEGKDIFDVDKDKGRINNIIQFRISPILNYNVEFLPCQKGDLLIIHVEKKKDIPHAYILSKESHEIKNRIYYIKTPHDKRLVSDSQLKFLFQEEKINIFYPFEIVLSLIIPELKLAYFEPNRSAGLRFLQWDFLSEITPEISMEIRSDSNKIQSLFQEIIPYALLYSFCKNFYRTWQFTQYSHERRYGKPNIPIDKIPIEEIPNLPNDSLLSTLSLNMKEIMKKRFFNNICVPPDTKIFLGFEAGAFPIIIKNNNFEFKIVNDIIRYGTHLESKHSLLYDIIERNIDLKDQNLFYINLSCVYEANFLFPNEYDEFYNDYIEYGKNIKAILMKEWDFNYFIENQPDPILFSIDKKLDKILEDKK